MAPSRATSQAEPIPRFLALPVHNNAVDRHFDSTNPLPSLAIIWAVLGCLLSGSMGIVLGRHLERERQLGQVLAMQQTEQIMWEGLATIDSLERVFRYRLGLPAFAHNKLAPFR